MNKNKIIWISGASTGIGKATAIKFIEEGWIIAASSRNQNKLDILKNEVEEKFGLNKIQTFICDIREKEQVDRTISEIEENIGPIDIALLNAGTAGPNSDDFKLDHYNYVVKTNISGNLNCIDSVYHVFKKRKKGHISIVASIVGYRGLPTASSYTMSKAALINLAESMYFDLKKFGVRISIINPGFIKTAMISKNTFPMPFLKSPEYAAVKIYNGLVKSNKFEIIFPFQWILIIKVLRLLPYKIYFFLVSKFTNL